jgi:leader peptidase (prepilin peptidase)/N-methyltransferase
MAMSAVSVVRFAPATPTTTIRMRDAWNFATQTARRAALAAATTSVAVGTAMPAPWSVRFAVSVVGVLLVAAALVDHHERRIPNRLLTLAAVVTVAGAVSALNAHHLLLVGLGALTGGGALLAVHLRRGVGMGDVKMAAIVGASCGWLSFAAAPIAVAVAALAASMYGVWSRRSSLALGPSLWFGWSISIATSSAGWWT